MSSSAFDSLSSVKALLRSSAIPSDALYADLESIDRIELARLLGRLKRVDAYTVSKTNRSQKAKKANLAGAIYERVVAVVFKGVKCFDIVSSVRTGTHEIDILVKFNSYVQMVPQFEKWHSHGICECKFHDQAKPMDWVSKLHSNGSTKGSNVGLLVTKSPFSRRGNGVAAITQIQIVAGQTPPFYILRASLADIEAVAKGKNFIKVLADAYVDSRIGK